MRAFLRCTLRAGGGTGGFEQALARVVQAAVIADLGWSHVGVEQSTVVSKSVPLALTTFLNPVPHPGRRFAQAAIGQSTPLKPIYEFGASSYTEKEAKSLSEIIDAFNERQGTEVTEDDFLRFDQVNREVLDDEDMIEMLRNNPPDVVFSAFSDAFFQEAIRMFQRDSQMKSIVLSDQQARDQAIQHFFNRALRQVREADIAS